ncbi:MAG TPA: DUF2264 domain-containing protein [Actinoplanes sp.]|nr:DUF2264 domain-containing protein [Actinoplanes sp.]
MPLHLPPEDRSLSPLTGWTRAHWEAVADHLLAGVEPWATDGWSQYRLPGPPSRNGVPSDGLEGFARTFVLAACRETRLDRYAEGLVTGTTPGHPFAWPEITDMSQSIVEAASIAIALHETRDQIFDRLGPVERRQVTNWLRGVIGKRTPDSNWILFTWIVSAFLETVDGSAGNGSTVDGESRVDGASTVDGVVSRLDDWYTGDGWYSDGPGQNFDYYNAMALHLYPVLWARMTGRENPYRHRLNRFLQDYQHFFAPDGSPVFQGRSLTYRFATVAPLWFGDELPPGRARRLASGVLKQFLEKEDGDLLTLGWHRPFPPMIQPYSGPASPYWASKAFLGLLLPETHPVWTATEEPAEIEIRDVDRVMKGPGWRLHGTRKDGVIRLFNHGSDRAGKSPEPDPLYVRLAYSTHTAPQFGPDAVDNRITAGASARHRIERLGDGISAYTDGPVRIVTTSTIQDDAEVRVHQVTAPPGLLVRDGGHALATPRKPAGDKPAPAGPAGGAEEATATAEPARTVTAGNATVTAEPDRTVTAGNATVTGPPGGLTSSITAVEGFTTAGIRDSPAGDVFGEHAATPYLEAIHPGGTHRYVSVVRLHRATA